MADDSITREESDRLYKDLMAKRSATAPEPAPIAEASPVSSKKLEGTIEFTEPMTRNVDAYTKSVFPQAEDSPAAALGKKIALPLRSAAEGFISIPENIGNAVAGGVQSLAGVKKPVTIGDMMRRIPGNEGYVSPTEREVASSYQAAMHQTSPMNQGLNAVAKVGGGFAFPLGAAQSVAMRAPLAARMIPGAASAVAKLGALGEEIPAVQNAASMLRKLQANAKYSPLQATIRNPLVNSVAAGGAYGTLFGAGNKFGQTRQMPTQSENLSNAVVGAGLGVGTGLIARAIAKMLLKADVAKLARQSPTADYQSEVPAQKDVLPPEDFRTNRQGLVNSFIARQLGHPNETDRLSRLEKMLKHESESGETANDSDEHKAALLRIRDNLSSYKLARNRELEKREVLSARVQNRDQQSAANKQDQRQYSENQFHERQRAAYEAKQENRQHSQQQFEQHRAETHDLTREHTEQSGHHYRNLSNEIESAGSLDHLNDLRHDIFDAGPGPTGKPLLDAGQKGDLRRAYYKKRRELGGEPGESKVSGGREPQPGTPHNSESSPETEAGAQSESPVTEHAAPHVVPVENRHSSQPAAPERETILGDFRRAVTDPLYKHREGRYQFAVSVETLAKAAGWTPQEQHAAHRWVEKLSEARLGQTMRDREIDQLRDWAIDNRDEWIGEQYKVKARQTTDKETQNDDVIELRHTERQGKFGALFFRTSMEREWEAKTGVDLEHVEHEGQIITAPRPTVRVTTCGIAHEHSTSPTGKLDIKGGIESLSEPEFTPPKSADDLFERTVNALEWRNDFRKEVIDIKKAAVIKNSAGKVVDNHAHLGERNIVDLMASAFEKLKLPFIEGRAPSIHVWHVGESGHVSTVEFQQPRTAKTLDGALQQIADAADAALSEPKEKRDVLLGTNQNAAKFLGLLPMVPDQLSFTAIGLKLAAKPIDQALEAVKSNRASQFVLPTLDDIFLAHPEHGGVDISNGMHSMLARVLSAFIHNDGRFVPVRNAEEMASLLTEFKGIPVSRSSFRRRAAETLQNIKDRDGALSSEEIDLHMKRADTALMLRSEYNKQIPALDKLIAEFDNRAKDLQSGKRPTNGKYQPHELFEGQVRESAYPALYHDALKKYKDNLTLRSSAKDSVSSMLGDIFSRKALSIFGNNPSVAAKNALDMSTVVAARYHKNFLLAASDLMTNAGGVRANVEKIPIAPAANMNLVQLEERMANRGKAENFAQAAAIHYEKVIHFLATKADFIFGGKERLVSAPDHYYTQTSLLSSWYEQADELGEDRHEFVNKLFAGGFTKADENKILSRTSREITQYFNSVAPHLNEDLFASSPIGKLVSGYSAPGRRVFKIMLDLYRKGVANGDPKATAAFAFIFLGMAAQSGRGAIPQSFQWASRLGGMVTGENEPVESYFQWWDQWNMLSKFAGIDYSNSGFGPDFATTAKPVLDSLDLQGKVARAGQESHSQVEAVARAAVPALFETLSPLPKAGPFGFDVWMKGVKGGTAASQGRKRVYFDDIGLGHVEIDYNYNDAMRDFLVGGTNPKATPLVEAKKLQTARNADAKYWANKH